MNPGKLQNRVQFFTYGKTQDGFGGYTRVQNAGDTVWGYAKEISGEYTSRDGARQRHRETEVIIRKKTFNEINGNEFGFKVDGGSMHRVTNVFENEIDKYVKIVGIKVSS